MSFLNPELLSITQSKQMGLWSPGGLPSFGITQYIKRLSKPKITILDVGVKRGENAYYLFETDTQNKIEKICGVEYPEDDFGSLIKENLSAWNDRFFIKSDQMESDQEKFDVVCVNTTDLSDNDLDKYMNKYYDYVSSGGIFCGNNHSTVKTKEALSRLRRTKKIGIPINVSFDSFFWYAR